MSLEVKALKFSLQQVARDSGSGTGRCGREERMAAASALGRE